MKTFENDLQSALGCSAVFARLIASRGFTTVEAVQKFLSPSLEKDWLDPYELRGMEDVVTRLDAALTNDEHICVFGDFDLDGISATALMVRALRKLGATQVSYLIPKRIGEGYGLSANSVPKLLSLAPDLVVTVDNGVSADAEIKILQDAGIDVVVTDHHEPGDNLPKGIPILNPKMDPDYGKQQMVEGYPEETAFELSGAAVALKLVQALGVRRLKPLLWLEYLDLATLGTVADVINLTGESRALVAAGIEQMRVRPLPGLTALTSQLANVDQAQITAQNIAFIIGPRLNAAGRVGDPVEALKLLLEDDPETAQILASRLIDLNQQRQEVERELGAAAVEQAQRNYDGQRALVLAGAGWHEGVRGIVASRLAERYGVPTIVASINDQGLLEGSARSVGKVDLFKAFSACSDLFSHFGGHAGAAGLTLKATRIDEFKQRLFAYLDTLPQEEFAQQRRSDIEVNLAELDYELSCEFERLEPCGEGNPRPIFSARSIEVTEAKAVGAEGTHLRFMAQQQTARVPAIWFRADHIDEWLSAPNQAPPMGDAIFKLDKDTFRGRKGVQLNIIEVSMQGDDFLRGLYERAPEIVQRREYAGISDAESFHTKLVGVTFEGRQELIEKLTLDDKLELLRDTNNDFDQNAIAIVASRLRGIKGGQLGFLNRDLARELAPVIDDGTDYHVRVADITGGSEDTSARGVNILIARADAEESATQDFEAGLAERRRLATLPADQLRDELRRVFIGEGRLHDAQAKTLDSLAQDNNTLTVMATGRGKSLIFHIHAAVTAIKQGKPSIFIYPLRALVSDQAYHLEEAFARIGLKIAVITGETSVEQREDSYAQLSSGQIDIVLTTPEYLHFHAESFAAVTQVGFVVIDEAHHIGQSRAGNRPAYAQLGAAIAKLGSKGRGPGTNSSTESSPAALPTTLAVTATAGTEVAARICETLGIEKRILDPHVRENLLLVDKRTEKAKSFKQKYVLQLAEEGPLNQGSKLVIYVNSRKESVTLARIIRKALPDLAWKTSFYNGGMKRAERAEVESRFRSGDLRIIIATSAFGEGVNIGDIRDVMLYHFPFSAVEFNQMSGRAGRDGKPAHIHLLFNEEDAQINRFILMPLAPPRLSLAALYHVLRRLVEGEGNGFKITNRDLAELANDQLRKTGAFDKGKGRKNHANGSNAGGGQSARDDAQVLREETVSQGLGIFRELGLVTTAGHSSARTITLTEGAAKVDLQSSVRYLEGQDEQADFETFREWALFAAADELRDRFTRPILPQ
ncbi:MAG: single-stranded-DNA-specific exonuclease RecJ [Coriobacteriia bacterium]|nr:single-stranded-DNA-specific exonuclease RecJ [Coriobacteriia bacterium]MCL2745856.1 single-stranded-DNA-specific exonuclease RecJ [Coriobacteriia bacterium]MCL2870810.1 single-stranded-DNA-specific exonuclease RecJ [Coriobacteriia bacterium]